MNVLFCPCGEGFGHTTRCIASAKEFLNRGHKVYFAAYGYSKEFLEMSGFKVFDTEREISLTGKNGRLEIKKSVLLSKNVGYNIMKAVYKEYNIMKNINADIVIADTKLSPILAAKLKGIPSIFISNQIRYDSREKIFRLIGYIINKFMGLIARLADEIVIPDFPNPYTICQYNINAPKKFMKKIRFIGPIIRYDTKSKHSKKNFIFSMIGAFGYRAVILKNLIKLAEKRKDIKFILIPGSKVKGLKPLKNVRIIKRVKDVKKYLDECELAVIHGGHVSIMEILSFGKPGIVIPDLNHPEQEGNARKFSELKCGIRITHDRLSPETLNRAIDKIRSDSIYRKNAERFYKLSKKYNGRKNLFKLAEKLTKNALRTSRQEL